MKEELARHAKGRDAKGRAAQYYDGLAARWLISARAVDSADRPRVDALLGRLQQLEQEKAPRGFRPRTDQRANLGEAESILHAWQQGYVLLAHDLDAKRVAREVGVPATTVVDLAKWLIANGANVHELGSSLLDLQAADIDTGRWINGVMDLVPRQR
ncbi:hypothetical protein ACFWDN_08150 [Micromonospora chalcea]